MGNKIVKLHGCSGAGKTTVARVLMEMADNVMVIEPTGRPGKHEAYAVYVSGFDRPVFLLGSYQNACGGMDTVASAEEAMKMVRFYAKDGHVFHEGLLQSTYYGAMGKDSQQYGQDYIYAFLNTPIEVCLARVEERRKANGSTNKFNPELTINKWTTINRLRNRVKAMGHAVYDFDYQVSPVPQLRSLFNNEGH